MTMDFNGPAPNYQGYRTFHEENGDVSDFGVRFQRQLAVICELIDKARCEACRDMEIDAKYYLEAAKVFLQDAIFACERSYQDKTERYRDNVKKHSKQGTNDNATDENQNV